MQIIVNGKITECKENLTLDEWLQCKGYQKERIAIEVNEATLPKAEYANYRLAPNDKLEVVSFVGGG